MNYFLEKFQKRQNRYLPVKIIQTIKKYICVLKYLIYFFACFITANNE